MNKGFTLLELIVVVVILGIVIAFLIPKMQNIHENTYESLTRSEMGEIVRAIIGNPDTGHQGFLTHMKRPPKDAAGYRIIELYSNVDGIGFDHVTQTGWDGPYIADMNSDGTVDADEANEILNDAWGNPYDYSLGVDAWNNPMITITSDGPDGLPGTGDDIIIPFVYAEIHEHT